MKHGTRLCTFCRKLAAFIVASEGLCQRHFTRALSDRPNLRFVRLDDWAPQQERRLEANRRSYRRNAERYRAARRARYRANGERALLRSEMTPEQIERKREIQQRSYRNRAAEIRAKRKARYWRQKEAA